MYTMEERDKDVFGRGVVVVVYHLGAFHFFPDLQNGTPLRIGSRVLADFPFRPHAIHYCMNDRKARLIVSFALREL